MLNLTAELKLVIENDIDKSKSIIREDNWSIKDKFYYKAEKYAFLNLKLFKNKLKLWR